jgi:signal peptidase I
MFYLARGRLGLVYSLISFIMAFALPVFLEYQHIAYPTWVSILVFLAYHLVASLHVYAVASNQPPRTRYPWYAKFYNWILMFFLAPFLLALTVRSFVVQPYTIPANSMRPALENGDYIIAEKLAFGIGQYSLMFGLGPKQRVGGRLPERGEVIIFALPSDPRISFVKRVIGLPGDRVMLREGRLYLNGIRIDRKPYSDTAIPVRDGETLYLEHLPDGLEYPILETSDDSRGDNTVEWQVPDRHYFVMGDNRDNSLDSRFDVGFVPSGNIAARPWLRLFNRSSPDRSFSRLQ